MYLFKLYQRSSFQTVSSQSLAAESHCGRKQKWSICFVTHFLWTKRSCETTIIISSSCLWWNFPSEAESKTFQHQHYLSFLFVFSRIMSGFLIFPSDHEQKVKYFQSFPVVWSKEQNWVLETCQGFMFVNRRLRDSDWRNQFVMLILLSVFLPEDCPGAAELLFSFHHVCLSRDESETLTAVWIPDVR